ncbi:hypothetical protein [Tautonia plasticadhaerens]|nr:hypothetical protein [Tautonia plasticadhaerens]
MPRTMRIAPPPDSDFEAGPGLRRPDTLIVPADPEDPDADSDTHASGDPRRPSNHLIEEAGAW